MRGWIQARLYDEISLTVAEQNLFTAHWADLAEAVFVVVTTHQNTTAWTLTPPPVIFLVAETDTGNGTVGITDCFAGTAFQTG